MGCRGRSARWGGGGGPRGGGGIAWMKSTMKNATMKVGDIVTQGRNGKK